MSAQRWKDAHGERLVEAALTHDVKEWAWVTRGWGVLLELGFADESDWPRFRATAAVRTPPPISRAIYGMPMFATLLAAGLERMTSWYADVDLIARAINIKT